MKYFIITIDTEGDNLWEWDRKTVIGTRNADYLPRFQDLCNQYGFKPVWLTNYEMISDPFYTDFICKVEEEKNGELGMHLHAWNTPPEYQLDVKQSGKPYLIEYPEAVMEEKIAFQTSLIESRTGIRPASHRAGRWAMDDRYYKLLQKYGYHVDCSVTPNETWEDHKGATENGKGSDYVKSPEEPYWIDAGQELLEVPVTIRRSHHFFVPETKSLRKLGGALKRMMEGQTIWLRPGHSAENQMYYLIDRIASSDSDYLMFMLHSSEFMPGGSPKFATEESIEHLYMLLNKMFQRISRDFRGITLRDYYEERKDHI